MTATAVPMFVSHGAPTIVLDDTPAVAMLRGLGARLGSPRAILVVSAHWDTLAPRVSLAERPETIHDFSGFPRALYALRYAAPGAPAVGARVLSLLRAAGFSAEGDAQRGLDHGAWTPLMLMRAAADIPVLQLSLQSRLGPRHHYELGRALAPLAREGVLLLGSGSFTHNFAELRWQARAGEAAPWALEFRDWMRARAQQGEVRALLEYRSRAPHGARAHPTDEHLLPLYVALGAASGADGAAPAVSWHAGGVELGALVMDAVSFGPVDG